MCYTIFRRNTRKMTGSWYNNDKMQSLLNYDLNRFFLLPVRFFFTFIACKVYSHKKNVYLVVLNILSEYLFFILCYYYHNKEKICISTPDTIIKFYPFYCTTTLFTVNILPHPFINIISNENFYPPLRIYYIY